MKRLRLFVLLLLLPVCAQPEEIYHIHRLSERDVLQTYTRLLRDACRHADRDWKNSSFDPAAGFWGDGVSDGNQGTRAVVSMVLACATLLKYDDGLSTGERRDLLAKTTAALRYVTATHVTGTQKCTNGKPWGDTGKKGGESWQSGMWTGTLAFGAWLIWDKLDPALQQDLQRVIASEDDILARRKPPNGLWLDTKAEENGWEVPCLVLGELMFPAHPHAAAWHEGALKYMMNTLCTEADTHETNLVDGRAVNQWVGGANLQPDFTLENHNFFHPSYVACSSYFLTQAAMYYTYAGRPIPQAATHHLMDTWRMFQTIILPWGEAAYPQGMDWELHSLPYINLFASLGTHWKDPFAVRMEQGILQYMRAWQMMCQGSLAFPGSRFGIARHAINAEQASYAYLAHKIFGPPAKEITARKAASQFQGTWAHDFVEFIAHRTESKFASFSWKNRIMGLLIPIGPGHDANPDFTVPITSGFVGSFDLTPKKPAAPKAVEHLWKEAPNGFETTGSLLLNGGLLKQTIRVTSVGKQAVVYQDRVTALSDVSLSRELGVPVGIENDELTGGKRVVYYRDGQTTFDWKTPRKPLALPRSSWANVDGRLGVVMVVSSGLSYHQAAGYDPHIAVCPDILYGSFSDRPRHFKAGDQVAQRIVLFFVEVTPKTTSALSQSFSIAERPGSQVIRFKLPEGGEGEVPLLSAGKETRFIPSEQPARP